MASLIEQRKSFEAVATNSAVAAIQFALKDVEANLAPLLAEIERLRAEVEMLRRRAERRAEAFRSLSQAASKLLALGKREAAWQPIETVPNTSEVVLFCDKRGNRWTQCANSWDIPECGLPAAWWKPLHPAPAPEEDA